MKTSLFSAFLSLGLLTQGCSGDDFTESPGAGAGGQPAGGTGGSAGQGGSTTAGKGGGAGLGGTSGASGQSGQAGAAGGIAGQGGTSGGQAGSGGAGAGGCDTNIPSSATTLFVSQAKGSDANPGTAALPLQSLAQALQVADIEHSRIVVDAGIYSGAVTIDKLYADVTIEGGWKNVSNTWQRDCSDGAHDKTILTSTALNTPVVTVKAIDHKLTLHTLTIKTKEQGESKPDQSGESLIGVLVSGNGSDVTLDDVVIEAGKAGDGGQASPAAPAPAPSCDGVTNCSNGESGDNGENGQQIMQGGTFGPEGYTPADGNPGKPGESGKNGTMGGAGKEVACSQCIGDNEGSCGASAIDTFAKSSGTGKCGCGGIGGPEGKAGRAGGASAGLVAQGSVTISIEVGEISSAQGGRGSKGTEGSESSSETSGTAGENLSCKTEDADTKCIWNSGQGCILTGANPTEATGGATGGNGGKGGKGGKGSGGSGGPSYAIMKVDGAKVVVDPKTKLSHGEGGLGADGAPAGMSGEIGSSPLSSLPLATTPALSGATSS